MNYYGLYQSIYWGDHHPPREQWPWLSRVRGNFANKIGCFTAKKGDIKEPVNCDFFHKLYKNDIYKDNIAQ